ncbi:hypothetical protein D3C80_2085690 [compost metagenome]
MGIEVAALGLRGKAPNEGASDALLAVDHCVGHALTQFAQGFGIGADDQVAAQQQAGFALGNARRVQRFLAGGDAQV